MDVTDTEETTTANVATEHIDLLIEAWRRELDGQGSVPATEVQDRLLDLWGCMPQGDPRAAVERWLTETLERHLYQAADVDARLARVLPGD